MFHRLNEVRPFRALHYDSEKIDNIGLCLARPYDVISPEKQQAYYRQHPYNVIRLILNKDQAGDNESENPYTRAKNHLARWETDGMRCVSAFLMPGPKPPGSSS